MEKIKRLDFDKNDNNKLLCLNFIAVVPPVSMFDPGEKLQVRLDGRHFCYVEVLDKKDLVFEELISAGYNYLDAGLGKKDYFSYLCSKFSKKKWFQGNDTIYTVVFFKKIVQLNLFDDNENFNPNAESVSHPE